MSTHKNAKTTPHGRAVMVRRIEEEGWTAAEVAAAFAVSERTVRKWLARYRAEGPAGLQDRSSRACTVANRLAETWVGMVLRLRRDYRLTASEIAVRLQLARSTVAAHLAAAGLGRLSRLEPTAPVRRYQRQRPGELLHLDIKKLARFRKTGHRITGNRRNASDGAGWEFVHVAVDDASRLAYVEVLADERRQSCTGFLVRALRWFKQRGIRVERVMSDNGSGYVSRLFAKVCRLLRIRHLRTRPYTPKTNGKAERFIQTLLREWAYALPYRSADSRAADLPRWLAWYNTGRPHAGLAGRAPATMLQAAA
jgi:transposase InsO family protein